MTLSGNWSELNNWVPWGVCSVVGFSGLIMYHYSELTRASEAREKQYHMWGSWFWGIFLAWAVLDLARDVYRALAPVGATRGPCWWPWVSLALLLPAVYACYRYTVSPGVPKRPRAAKDDEAEPGDRPPDD